MLCPPFSHRKAGKSHGRSIRARVTRWPQEQLIQSRHPAGWPEVSNKGTQYEIEFKNCLKQVSILATNPTLESEDEALYFPGTQQVHIIDLTQTVDQLQATCNFGRHHSGWQILFVGTKKQAQPIVRELAETHKQHFVTDRWLGGMLTNLGQ